MECDLKLVISKPSIYFCLQPAWPELGTDQPWFVVFFSLFCFKEVFIAKNCLSYSVLKQKTINESEFIGLRYPPKHAKIGWFGLLKPCFMKYLSRRNWFGILVGGKEMTRTMLLSWPSKRIFCNSGILQFYNISLFIL